MTEAFIFYSLHIRTLTKCTAYGLGKYTFKFMVFIYKTSKYLFSKQILIPLLISAFRCGLVNVSLAVNQQCTVIYFFALHMM